MENLLLLLEILDSRGGTLRRSAVIQHLGLHLSTELNLNLRYLTNGLVVYSSRLDSAIGKAKALGFLWESPAPAGSVVEGFDARDFEYHLTPDGMTVLGSLRGRFGELSTMIRAAISQMPMDSALEPSKAGLAAHRVG
jgi:hypothetical protein